MGRRLLLVLVAALLLAGCGRDQTRPPDLSQARLGRGFVAVRLPAAGLSIQAPRGWVPGRLPAPGVGAFGSGPATVAVWRYRRSERLPATAAELAAARDALVAEARRRDTSFALSSARVTLVAGAPAVELVADETVGRSRRRVRSLHLYAHGAEIVVDAYAPPGEFARIDRAVFRPLVATLRLTAPASD